MGQRGGGGRVKVGGRYPLPPPRIQNRSPMTAYIRSIFSIPVLQTIEALIRLRDGEFNIEVQRPFKNQAALHNWSKIT